MTDDEMTDDEFTKWLSTEFDDNYKAPHHPLVYNIGNQIPVYELCGSPPMKVATIIGLIEECVSVGGEIPHRAFVSGPEMNYRFQLEFYKADTHESLVADRLMEMTRRGADRIATVSEVWLRNADGTICWHGVMVTEATVLGDICYTAEFEGKRQLGAWHKGPANGRCNLTRLFQRAVAGNQNGTDIQSTHVSSKSEVSDPLHQALYHPTVDEIKKLFSEYDRGNDPPVEVSDLIAEIEERLSLGKDIPSMAFVTGPRINYRVEFNDYNGGWHRLLVSEGLMEMIRRGVERIVIISEVWFRNDDGIPQWHGVNVLEATASGDICHMLEFEGDRRIGEWHSRIPDTGDLARLFERAVAGNQNGVKLKSTHDPHKP